MASYKDRQRVRCVLEEDFNFEMSLDAMLEILSEIKNEYPDHDNFFFDKDYPYYDDSSCYRLIAYREETDKEYQARLDAHKAERARKREAKAKKEEADRKEYERLRAKFEQKAKA